MLVKGDAFLSAGPLPNIVAWLLDQAPADVHINATPGQLEAWREDEAILAFLRSEELSELNLDSSTLKFGQHYHDEGQRAQAWRDHNLAALLDSMTQITLLNLSNIKSKDRNPYSMLSTSSGLLSSEPIALLCNSICGLLGLRTLCIRGFFGDRRRPMNGHTMVALADAMERMPQLEVLDLRDNIFCREHVPILANALQGLLKLTELKLFGSGCIHAEQVQHDALAEGQVLFGAISRLCSLQTLYIMGHGHMPKHAPAVATALSNALLELTQLVALNLRYHTFCQDGASSLGSALQRLTGLTELIMGVGVDLVHNTIDWGGSANTAEAMSALIAPLSSLTSLTNLETYNGPVADGTMKALAAVIQRMPRLVSIEVGYYGFGCDGATVIAGALAGLTGLTKIGMGANNITDAGLFEVASAIERLPGLTELDLDYALSHCTRDGAIAIAKALTNLTRLKLLRIRGSNFPSSAEEWQYLRDALLGMPLLEDLVIDYEPRDLDWGISELKIESLPDEIIRRGWISTLEYVRKIGTHGGKQCGWARGNDNSSFAGGSGGLKRGRQDNLGKVVVYCVDDRDISRLAKLKVSMSRADSFEIKSTLKDHGKGQDAPSGKEKETATKDDNTVLCFLSHIITTKNTTHTHTKFCTHTRKQTQSHTFSLFLSLSLCLPHIRTRTTHIHTYTHAHKYTQIHTHTHHLHTHTHRSQVQRNKRLLVRMLLLMRVQ